MSCIFRVLVGPIIVRLRFFSNGWTNLRLLPPPLLAVNEFIRIKLGFKVINHVQFIKYILVFLWTSLLSWKPQITELSKKSARTSGIFHKIDIMFLLKDLYYLLFYSSLSCGIPTWGLTHPTTLDTLLKVQKKVTI